MIKESILNEFKSSTDTNKYIIVITNITGDTKCNQESLSITAHKVRADLAAIEGASTKVIEKKLEIISDIGYDSDGIPISKLIGYKKKDVPSPDIIEGDSLSSHSIEIVQAPLQEEIEVKFAQEYLCKPGYIINIDSKYQSLYKSTSITYLSKDVKINDTDTTVYYGAKIKFNSLKRRGQYPDIKIIIIGDKNDTDVSA